MHKGCVKHHVKVGYLPLSIEYSELTSR